MFGISGKVALVTGGAAGIGLAAADELLKEGARGVAIADISKHDGEKTIDILRKKYGHEKVIFVRTDVTKKSSLDDAFKHTLAAFNNIDIVVNNAGIFNDKNYELCIDVNITGAVHCLSLAIDKYLPTYKSGSEAVIINTTSEAGTFVYPFMPVYSATKSALLSLTMSLGNRVFFNRNKVRVVGIAPGLTQTALVSSIQKDAFNDLCSEYLGKDFGSYENQSVDYVARCIMEIIKTKPSGTVWIAAEEKELVEFIPALPTYEYEDD
ncbi:15-hydroxyprostaglandin dehydrogenase [NAD(+)]-like [Coccinella septempunctata]|uniref:15-hydroxyprostaglandin dehydrogenase [NAD(+)]-like n=1 Tax=Coccinella septempunctata TaxID=41139 RepID=UPI001D05D7EC|nr:15-hydroxyprostaglandin dehydrogenase [NAD(+)]-like [Coccinella septempunctata]